MRVCAALKTSLQEGIVSRSVNTEGISKPDGKIHFLPQPRLFARPISGANPPAPGEGVFGARGPKCGPGCSFLGSRGPRGAGLQQDILRQGKSDTELTSGLPLGQSHWQGGREGKGQPAAPAALTPSGCTPTELPPGPTWLLQGDSRRAQICQRKSLV